MNDIYTPYESGIKKLLELVNQENNSYSNLTVYEQRLNENIAHSRLYGDAGEQKATRSEIIHQLNIIALNVLGTSFNDLCTSTIPIKNLEGMSKTPKFSLLASWKPNSEANGFGADVLLEDELNKEEIVTFVKYLADDFNRYTNDKTTSPICIRIWSSELAFEQNQKLEFGDEFRTGYLVYFVRNLTNKGAYKGFNEIRWMQEIGKFSELFGQKTKLN